MIELLNCDCMEYMKGLPDKAFDLAIVDPPYGLGEKITSGGTWASKLSAKDHVWDIAPDASYFKELCRVSVHQIVWGGNHFGTWLGSTRGFIVWDKKLTDNWTLAMAEFAWTSFDKPSKIFRASLSEGVQKEGERIHICQKPIKLYRWLLHNYAKPGDRILDTHGGSMSSAIACHQMGFDATVLEIDKDYYDAACKRFKEQTMQQTLFK